MSKTKALKQLAYTMDRLELLGKGSSKKYKEADVILDMPGDFTVDEVKAEIRKLDKYIKNLTKDINMDKKEDFSVEAIFNKLNEIAEENIPITEKLGPFAEELSEDQKKRIEEADKVKSGQSSTPVITLSEEETLRLLKGDDVKVRTEKNPGSYIKRGLEELYSKPRQPTVEKLSWKIPSVFRTTEGTAKQNQKEYNKVKTLL